MCFVINFGCLIIKFVSREKRLRIKREEEENTLCVRRSIMTVITIIIVNVYISGLRIFR